MLVHLHGSTWLLRDHYPIRRTRYHEQDGPEWSFPCLCRTEHREGWRWFIRQPGCERLHLVLRGAEKQLELPF